MGPFKTIEEIKRANIRADHHWFDRGNMRFHGSRILPTVYLGRYFITSEYTGFDRQGRAYTVRMANDDGTIDTVGEFLAHRTRERAIRAMWSHLNSL